MRTGLAPAIVLRELARLLDVYARPKHWTHSDEQVAHKWAEIFGDLAPEQLTAAVTAYCREDHQFMPRPGTLRVLAVQQRRLGGAVSVFSDYALWQGRGYTDTRGQLLPCPCCGRAWQEQPRITLVHDHAKHRAAGIPCSGSCDEMGCVGTYGAPPSCVPTAVSAGALWVPPEGWSSELKAMSERREALKRQDGPTLVEDQP